MDSIGERVLEVRKDAKLTQNSFAKQIGISQTHVSKIEKGVEHPSQTLIKYISYRYNVNEGWLKTGEGVMHPASDTAEYDLITALKRFETDIPRQFKNGDVMMIAQILHMLYYILTIEMPREKYSVSSTEWFEFPAHYIDEISHSVGIIASIASKCYEYNTNQVDSEYLIDFVKNITKHEAEHSMGLVQKLTTIPMEKFVQQ